MFRLYYCFFFLLFSNLILFAQDIVISEANADCHNALEITDIVWGPVNAPDGPGEIMELYGPSDGSYFFEEEHNSVWYYFKVPITGILTFDIIPEDIKDDYDFIIFRIDDTGFCSHPMNYRPVRSCISRNDTSIGSKTGLSSFAVGNHFPSGAGPSYCQELEVKNGEIYYLVLDNVYENGKGHRIQMHYSSEEKKNTVKKPVLNISVKDGNTHELINADIEVYEMVNNNSPILIRKFLNTMSCFLNLEYATNYAIRINKTAYLSYFKLFAIPDTQNIIYVNAGLRPLQRGDTLIFENIYFFGNQAVITPESYPSLEDIYNTLFINPEMTIEIRGHVNAPLSRYEPDSYMELSYNRAKSVYDYLLKKGIVPERMTYKGFANNMMLFPTAWKEEEMMLNRRVEVVIGSM